MRTISAALEKVLAGPYAVHTRVSIKDSGGTWRDMTALDGRDWVIAAEWGEGVDQPVADASIVFVRDVQKLSLAPLMQASKLNVLTGSYAPLVDIGREIKIETATVPSGITPVSGDWSLAFHGDIYEVDPTGEEMGVRARDLGGRLQDLFMERELIYGLERCHQLAPDWAASTVFPMGSLVAPGNGYVYEQIYSNGLTGTVEPTWPTTYGTIVDDLLGKTRWICWGQPATKYGAEWWAPSKTVVLGETIAFPYYNNPNQPVVAFCVQAGTTASTTPDFSAATWTGTGEITDGTAKWRRRGTYWSPQVGSPLHHVIAQMLIDHGYSASDLVVPVVPEWQLNVWQQDRKPLLDAMRDLALMIGWDLRYAYDSASGAFKLRLAEPDRSKTTADRTFTTDQHGEISGHARSLGEIRNVVRVVYSDASSLLPNGIDYERKTVEASDATSITAYGRRWCEVAESSASQIDSATEAQALADAILADLKDPAVEQTVDIPRGFPAAEVGDLYEFSANDTLYSAAQKLAVQSTRHMANEGSFKTSLLCRGKPSGGFLTWHKRLARPGVARSSVASSPRVPIDLTVVNGIGRSLVSFDPPRQSWLTQWSSAECYVSASSGFSPSAATLYQSGRMTTFVVLKTAGTYYAKVILRDRFGNASAASAQSTLTIS